MKSLEIPARQVGRTYKRAFESLNKSIPLIERYEMATKLVQKWVKERKRIVPLTTFFNQDQ